MGDAALVPSTDARAALAVLEKKDPPKLAYRLSFIKSAYRALPDLTERIGSKDVLAIADRLGFERLGAHDMIGIVPFVLRPKRERYVDPRRIVVMSMRRGSARGAVEGQMSKYFLVTFFDDGSVVTTWGKSAPIMSTDKTTERGGTGELDFDYKAHVAAIAEHAAKGRKALTIPDLATSLALGDYYDSRIHPESMLTILVMRLAIVTMVGAVLVKWWLHHKR